MNILIIVVAVIAVLALIILISKINRLVNHIDWLRDEHNELLKTLKLFKRYREFNEFTKNIYEVSKLAHSLKLHWEYADRKPELVLDYCNRLIKAADTTLDRYKPFKDEETESK